MNLSNSRRPCGVGDIILHAGFERTQVQSSFSPWPPEDFWSNTEKHFLRGRVSSPGMGLGSLKECPNLDSKTHMGSAPRTPWGHQASTAIWKSAFLGFLGTKYPDESESNLVFSQFHASSGQHNKEYRRDWRFRLLGD